MTETADDVQQLQPDVTTVQADRLDPLVPAGVDMLDDLTAAELSVVSRQIKCDVIEAIGGQDQRGLRWEAMPRVAWLWAKRRDPQAKLQPFLDMRPSQLGQLLRLDEDQAPELPADVDPMAPAPE